MEKPEAATPTCPRCGKRLEESEGSPRCASCDRAFLSRYLLYSLSLPERAVRSAVGLGAGAVREVAQVLVPQAFQDATTYRIVVDNSLRFLTEDIGGAQATPGSETTDTDYVARKAVGNFVDLAGLATLHVSPLWLLAIVSDVAYGTKTYVRELAEELQAKGLIDDASSIHRVDDVLEAVQGASGETATLFDTPPLSVSQLRATLTNVKSAVTSAGYRDLLPEAELERYWSEMREIATRENVGLIGASAGLTLCTLQKMQTVSSGVLSGIQIAGGLLNRTVVDHYISSLREVRERGFYSTLQDSYGPYVDAVWKNFAEDRSTWTEDVVSGRLLGRVVRKVKGWFGSGSSRSAPGEEEGVAGAPPTGRTSWSGREDEAEQV